MTGKVSWPIGPNGEMVVRLLDDVRGQMVKGGFHIESIRTTSIGKQARKLFVSHALECEPDIADDLAPDWAVYKELEKQGRLIAFGAWPTPEPWESVPFIAYAVAYLFRPAHYAGRMFAQLDALYVAPEYRSRRLGLHLIDRLEKTARSRGASRLLMHAKPGSRLAAMLPRLGFEVEETIFRRDLT